MLDPRVQAMFDAAAGKWPSARSLPPQQLRALAAQAAKGMPTLDRPLAAVRDDAIPGPGGPLKVRVYTPRGHRRAWPLIVVFHGGGWILGDLDSQDMIARGLSVSAGAMVMSVDYRLAPEHRFPAAAANGAAGFGRRVFLSELTTSYPAVTAVATLRRNGDGVAHRGREHDGKRINRDAGMVADRRGHRPAGNYSV